MYPDTQKLSNDYEKRLQV